MQLIKQINGTTCGQACLAMLLNTIIEDTIELVGHDNVTSDEEICPHLQLKAEKYCNPKDSGANVRLQLHQNPEDTNQKHWTVYYFGKTLDPAGFSDKKRWPLLKFWNIR